MMNGNDIILYNVHGVVIRKKYIENENGKLQHREFLAYPGKDPRRELTERLCADIPINVCTVAYNMTFEKTRIKD